MEDLENFLNTIEPKEPTEPSTEEPIENNVEEPNADPNEPVDPQPSTKEEEKPQKTNADFARERINKQKAELKQQTVVYEQALQRIAKQRGISVEELLEEQQNDADKREAQRKGIDPELQRTIRELQQSVEQSKVEAQIQRLRYEITNMQRELNLNDNDLSDFIKSTQEKGFDLRNDKIDLVTLYKAINYERLQKEAIESERQNWLAEQERKRNQSPSTTQTQSKGNSRTGKGLSLDEFLATLPKNL